MLTSTLYKKKRTTMQTWCFGLVAFAVTLVILSGIRFAFYTLFNTNTPFSEAWPAFTMGARMDLKWLSVSVWPAVVLGLAGLKFTALKRWAGGLLGVAIFFNIAIDIINIGFYQFYGTPISALIFGFVQDDTQAIIKTIWKDWPIFTYLAIFASGTLLPFVIGAIVSKRVGSRTSVGVTGFVVLLSIVLLGLGTRGSLSKFPLRQQNLNVSTNPFVNNVATNGAQALYVAVKSLKALKLDGDPETALFEFKFDSKDVAVATALGGVTQPQPIKAPKVKPNIVFAIMESMGRDEFEADAPDNVMLGELANQLHDAKVFLQGIAVNGGTYPSLEGLLLNTPYVPIMQSKYGNRALDFSKVKAFKEAGYRTVFLTAGSVGWRQLDKNLPLQGFDELYGEQAIMAAFPGTTRGVWGVGDEFMFKFAQKLLDDRKPNDKPLFLVMLSITNHSPHAVPAHYTLQPINPNRLPAFVSSDREDPILRGMLETYQYSTNALGDFVKHLREAGQLDDTVVAATGDHNARLNYNPNGYWHHSNGVPVLFWVPKSIATPVYDAKRWVSHRDILPTLGALALGKTPEPEEGRFLFAKADGRPAVAFYNLGDRGIAIDERGAIALNPYDKKGNPAPNACFKWEGDRLVATPCTPELSQMRRTAEALVALSAFRVREGVQSR